MWRTCKQHARRFASSTSLVLDVFPPHNQAIVGDSLFSIQLNYKWRKLVAQALHKLSIDDESTISLDNQDLLSALINDLYDAEVTVPTYAYKSKVMAAAFTVTSTTYAIVTDTNVSYTPSKANFRVTVHNLAANCSAGGAELFAEVRFNGVESTNQIASHIIGTQQFDMDCSAIFEGVSVGVAHDLSIYAKRVAANCTVLRTSEILYMIEEYD